MLADQAMARGAAGQGAIRLHELAMPSSIERMTAVSTAWYIPKSSVIDTPAARGSTAQLRVEPCGLSREVVAFGEAGR